MTVVGAVAAGVSGEGVIGMGGVGVTCAVAAGVSRGGVIGMGGVGATCAVAAVGEGVIGTGGGGATYEVAAGVIGEGGVGAACAVAAGVLCCWYRGFGETCNFLKTFFVRMRIRTKTQSGTFDLLTCPKAKSWRLLVLVNPEELRRIPTTFAGE